jgi:UDP-glucose 4-epimerase
MSARRALISGATGTIGAGLVDRLVREAWTVHVLTRAGSVTDRLAPNAKDIEVTAADWRDTDAIADVVKRADPSVVFHLAGPPFNPPTLPPSVFLDAAVNYTGALLQALDDAGNGARIVFANSAAIYGGGKHVPGTERVFEPATWLGAAKAMAATLLATAGRKTGRRIVDLRLFTPYGPGERAERLIPSLIAAAIAGREIALSAGTQERDFIYIDDVIDAFLVAANVDAPQPLAFDIGSGTGTRVCDVVTTLLDMLGASELARFGALPMRPDEIMHMAADLTPARALPGWAPHTSLESGLRSTIDWYKNESLHRV